MIQIQTLEELSLNAFPSLQQIIYDGWILRFAQGYTKRANSITPLYPGTLPLNTKIQYCEQVYSRFAQKPIFRLTNTNQTATLNQTLTQLGYQQEENISLQLKTIVAKQTSFNQSLITLNDAVSEEWLDHYVHAVNLPIQHWDTLGTILSIIPHPTCYAWLKDAHRFCCCGLGVLQNQYLGLYFIATAKQQRRKGYAAQLISAMLHWGKNNGATQAYLQVETENQAAINLYNKLGFTEVYQYFYRLKP
ncbi:GCN5-related N-acetyltransferase [Chondrocystis sp. NIES-4102]|nr:GCN5-related N-acetyltransferase [Chondrocystis sp. NIES-4102]